MNAVKDLFKSSRKYHSRKESRTGLTDMQCYCFPKKISWQWDNYEMLDPETSSGGRYAGDAITVNRLAISHHQ